MLWSIAIVLALLPMGVPSADLRVVTDERSLIDADRASPLASRECWSSIVPTEPPSVSRARPHARLIIDAERRFQPTVFTSRTASPRAPPAATT